LHCPQSDADRKVTSVRFFSVLAQAGDSVIQPANGGQVADVLDLPALLPWVPAGAERLGFVLLGEGSFEVDPHSGIVVAGQPSVPS